MCRSPAVRDRHRGPHDPLGRRRATGDDGRRATGPPRGLAAALERLVGQRVAYAFDSIATIAGQGAGSQPGITVDSNQSNAPTGPTAGSGTLTFGLSSSVGPTWQ